MAFREFHYTWVWKFQSSPEQLWPFVADTNRFNRDTGLPRLNQVDQPSESGERENSLPVRHLWFRRLGVKVAWDEYPFEWVRPAVFGVVRVYTAGPVREMRVRVELEPTAEGGSLCTYRVWAVPRNWLGTIAIPGQIGLISRRQFERTYRHYDQIAREPVRVLEEEGGLEWTAGGRSRWEGIRSRIESGEMEQSIGTKLEGVIGRGDEMTLTRLRPYALADSWGVERRDVLSYCLHATKEGGLDLSWDLLCPRCRGAKLSVDRLADIPDAVHCDACRIDFRANFDRLVEATFRPSASIMQVGERPYCVGGPQVTKHFALQAALAPGETKQYHLRLVEGNYRLRTAFGAGTCHARVEPGGAGELEYGIGLAEAEDSMDEMIIGQEVEIRASNSSNSRQVFVVEHLAWTDKAATAAEVTGLQLFRDLFSRDVLRGGDAISVGSKTILFTDLKQSTRMYREVGDATAFSLVMDHFSVLKEVLTREEGAIVKTIGDAVMAVFPQPLPALRAIFRAQRELGNPSNGSRPLGLKAGIHHGPCIAVTLNERLDYFGSTVNLAARLNSHSKGTDIIVTDTVLTDPEVARVIQEEGWVLERFSADLRGFEREEIGLARLSIPELT